MAIILNDDGIYENRDRPRFFERTIVYLFNLINCCNFRRRFLAYPNDVPTAENKQRYFYPIENSLTRLELKFCPNRYPPKRGFWGVGESTYPLDKNSKDPSQVIGKGLFMCTDTVTIQRVSIPFSRICSLTASMGTSSLWKIPVVKTACNIALYPISQ